jgi:hypothetical protein
VRALAFGLVPHELRPAAATRLVELIAEAGGHLGTGFLSTPFLLPVLADTGHLDVAYELLLQDTPPSWMAMRARGATTVWEEWEGIDADGVPHASLNHYSKGAVITFLHRYTPACRSFPSTPATAISGLHRGPAAGSHQPRPPTSRRTARSQWRGRSSTARSTSRSPCPMAPPPRWCCPTVRCTRRRRVKASTPARWLDEAEAFRTGDPMNASRRAAVSLGHVDRRQF